MRKAAILLVLLFTLSFCGTKEKTEAAAWEIVVDNKPPHPLSCALNISAWQFDPTGNVNERTLTRTVIPGALERDSLCYVLNKSDWYTPIPKSEGDVEYYIQMSLASIDPKRLRATYNEDEFDIHLYMLEGHKINISKIIWNGPIMRKIWSIEADSISLDFPNQIDRIREEFTQYQMLNPQTDCSFDYVKGAETSFVDTLIAEKVIRVLKSTMDQ